MQTVCVSSREQPHICVVFYFLSFIFVYSPFIHSFIIIYHLNILLFHLIIIYNNHLYTHFIGLFID